MPGWNRKLLRGSERRRIRRRLDPRLRLKHPNEIDCNEREDAGEQHDGRNQQCRRALLAPRPGLLFVHTARVALHELYPVS
jgi:hypothetical protein